MSVLVAIEIQDKKATLVTGETQPTGEVTILRVDELELPESESSTSDGPAQQIAAPHALEELVDSEIDATLALVPGSRVLFEQMTLPFRDAKTLDQVVPLQVQDTVPFEIEDFVIDTVVLSDGDDDGYQVLASAAPRQEIESVLQTLRRLGADPKVLTTRAAAVAALAGYFPEILTGSFVLLLTASARCSIAVFAGGTLNTLRETAGDYMVERSPDIGRLCRDIKSSILRTEHERSVQIDRVFIVSSTHLVPVLAASLPHLQVQALDLSRAITCAPGVRQSPNELSWAIGLFAHEARREQMPQMVNFRRGKYAYKPTWGNILAALREESFYIGLALVLALTWLGTLVYTSFSELHDVEGKIAVAMQQAFPGKQIPERREVQFLKDGIAEREAQLRDLGSLSPLSPLEALRELSLVVGPDLDLKIESINIGHAGLSFRGTVPDIPSAGKLDSSLKNSKGKFCNPKVETGSNVSGQGRTKFQAELSFCQ